MIPRIFLLACLGAGCAAGTPPNPRADAGPDAGRVEMPDGGRDAGRGSDAGSDAGMDGGRDAGSDAGDDAGRGTDAGICGPTRTGVAVALDGTDDLGAYPSAQILTPGAPLQPWERFALAWDDRYLYVTMVSQAFEDAFRPLHVYLEVDPAGAAVPSQGKEYNGRIAELPFTPTHVIAVRRTSDSGTGGPYDAIYTPASSWSDRVATIAVGTDAFVASDQHTISVRVGWDTLGCPRALRVSAHVVYGVAANDYKDAVPASATPWMAPGGGYYEIDLTADPTVSSWTER